MKYGPYEVRYESDVVGTGLHWFVRHGDRILACQAEERDANATAERWYMQDLRRRIAAKAKEISSVERLETILEGMG